MERITRRDLLKEGTSFIIALGLPPNLFPSSGEKIVFDIAGYKIPAVDQGNDSRVVADLESLSAKSAVIVNPSLRLVNSLRGKNIDVIVRPYFKHNQFNPDVLQKFLHYPHRLRWLPFVEPNIPEIIRERDENTRQCQETVRIKKIVRDPEEFAALHFIPFAKAVLARNGGENDVIFLPPTAQWAPGNEFDFLEAIYRVVKRHIPLKNLAVAQHKYHQEPGLSREGMRQSWSREIALYNMSTATFGERLRLVFTEAGFFQDSDSNFAPEVVADETIKFMITPIPKQLLEPLEGVNVWNLGFLIYAPREFKKPSVCNADQIRSFDKAAIISINGPTETYYRLVGLAQRRRTELRG